MAETAIVQRVIRLSIEIDGRLHVFDDLDIRARGRKSANAKENSCEVVVSNLTKANRDYLLTATSPFIANKRTPKRMIVEAGRAGGGLSRLFYGDITSSEISQPPDIGLTLRSKTGAYKKGFVVARNGRDLQPLSAIAAGVAADMGTSLTFEADDFQIANFSFSGAVGDQVDVLAAAGVDAYVDDQTLVVKNIGEGLRNRVRILNKHTGMIGVPEFTERGLRVRSLIDAETVLGGTIEVESEINPAANGRYVSYQIEFDIASREEAFYYITEARRAGQVVRNKRGGR